ASEALARIGFPTIESALKPLVRAIAKDADLVVRHRAIWAFLNVDSLESLEGAKDALLGVVRRKSEEERINRYDAARALARGLGPASPNEVIDTLAEMLGDTSVVVYNQTNADVKGGRESAGGQSTVKQDLGGDARYMAAEALRFVGPPAKKQNPKIVGLLKELAKSKDPLNQKYARLALEKIGE